VRSAALRQQACWLCSNCCRDGSGACANETGVVQKTPDLNSEPSFHSLRLRKVVFRSPQQPWVPRYFWQWVFFFTNKPCIEPGQQSRRCGECWAPPPPLVERPGRAVPLENHRPKSTNLPTKWNRSFFMTPVGFGMTRPPRRFRTPAVAPISHTQPLSLTLPFSPSVPRISLPQASHHIADLALQLSTLHTCFS
jgi:hypothetical protein